MMKTYYTIHYIHGVKWLKLVRVANSSPYNFGV